MSNSFIREHNFAPIYSLNRIKNTLNFYVKFNIKHCNKQVRITVGIVSYNIS